MIDKKLKIMITSRDFRHQGGVVKYVQLLMKNSASTVQFQHVVIGRRLGRFSILLRPLNIFFDAMGFIWMIVSWKPDVIHLNPSFKSRSLPENFLLLFFANLLGQRVLLFFHGWDDSLAQEMIDKPMSVKTLFIRYFLEKAGAYTVLGDGFKKQLVGAGIDSAKVIVTSVMVDVEQLQHNLATIGTGANIDDDVFKILFLSRVDRSKGIYEFLDAIEWIRKNYPDQKIRFTIAGDGPDLAPVIGDATKKGLDSYINFSGYVTGDMLNKLYLESDLFVFPAHGPEGFPTVIVEAMAAGLPIITTPVGSLSTILSDENCIFLSKNDLSGRTIAQNIMNLYLDPVRRGQMSKYNSAYALNFDVKTCCGQINNLYQQLCGMRKE